MSKKSNLEFRKIPSLQFLYEINGDGTIIRNVKSKKKLKCFKKHHNSNTEYWCTQINLKHKVSKHFIHNLVAECWLGPKPKGMTTDHIDRDSLNNDYRNLRYVTRSENMKNRDHFAFMDTILKNLGMNNGGKLNPVRLSRGGEHIDFPTARRAAVYLAKIYNMKEKSFNDRFYHRRKKIFDFHVKYLSECRD